MWNHAQGDIRNVNRIISKVVEVKPDLEDSHKQYKNGFFDRTYRDNIDLAETLFGEYIKFINKDQYFATMKE